MRGPGMSSIRRLAVLVLSMSSVIITSCDTGLSTSPESRASSDLHLLHVAAETPPLDTSRLSFYAVKGRATGIQLKFHARPGSSDSLALLKLQIGQGALDRHPDGSPIAQGDSVLISMRVVDSYHLVVDFQPEGLRFSATDRPILIFSWAGCGDDLNYDGRIDASDNVIVDRLGIWRQESKGLPWFKQNGVTSRATREVSASISGFTGYALAF